MKNKGLILLLTVSMTAALFAGCGSSGSDSAKSAEKETQETDANAEEIDDADGEEDIDEEEDEDLLTVSLSDDYVRTAADYKIAVIPKMTSLQWFERMETGIAEFNSENGSEVVYGGTTSGDDQAAYIQTILEEDWDAICVVPYDAEQLEPLLQQAVDQGITVITHEASDLDQSARDYDLEAFDNVSYGENFMEQIGSAVEGKGQYIQLVASSNTISHNQWCDAAKAYQEENYPDMECISRVETEDDIDIAYEKTKELLETYPDVTAIQGSASQDIIGAAKAVQELGLTDIVIVGTSMTSICREYVEDGTVTMFSMWDPAAAGQAMVELAVKVMNEEIEGDTVSLNAVGYEKCIQTAEDHVFYGDARIDVTAKNLDEYDF